MTDGKTTVRQNKYVFLYSLTLSVTHFSPLLIKTVEPINDELLTKNNTSCSKVKEKKKDLFSM